MTETRQIFVYGTLMRGELGHRWLAGARFLHPARTAARYELVSMGWYPALVEGGRTAVVGEIFAVPEGDMPALDAYEDVPALYARLPVELSDGTRVEAYLLHAHLAADRPRIPSGDWRRRG